MSIIELVIIYTIQKYRKCPALKFVRKHEFSSPISPVWSFILLLSLFSDCYEKNSTAMDTSSAPHACANNLNSTVLYKLREPDKKVSFYTETY